MFYDEMEVVPEILLVPGTLLRAPGVPAGYDPSQSLFEMFPSAAESVKA